jgi:predicted NBD/HSP70 family sugar kinase
MKRSKSKPDEGVERDTTTRSGREPGQVQVASSELTRDINRDVVLGRIRQLQPISRVDLARASGLQPSTVSSIVEQLLRERWIREGAVVKTARGRRPTLLSLNDNLVILVADVRPFQAVVALLDLNGRFLERQLVPLSRDPERAIAAIATVMKRFRQMHPAYTFEGVGVSLPGRVHTRTGRLLLAPNLPWRHFNIRKHLQLELGLEVQLENAANASLLSEIWFGDIEGIRNVVLLTISEGVGTAILAEGRMITGQRGMAGEFGHICMDPEGPLCGCGARGCWEVFASARAGLRYYHELVPNAGTVTTLDLMTLAIDGDHAADKALERQARAIGEGMHLLNAILSPDLILIASDIAAFSERYLDILERECRAGLMAGEGPRLRVIGDGEVARVRGAAAVALQRHSGYFRAAQTH